MVGHGSARQRCRRTARQHESLLTKPLTELSIKTEAADSTRTRELLDRYFGELLARFPEGAGELEVARIAAPATEFSPPHGVFLLAWRDGQAVGCGALRALDADCGEIKRMWVDPAARGLGVGRRLLDALEGVAVELGFQVVRLDTAAYLTEALRLYQSAGYEEIRAYNENPYAAHWLEKRLR